MVGGGDFVACILMVSPPLEVFSGVLHGVLSPMDFPNIG